MLVLTVYSCMLAPTVVVVVVVFVVVVAVDNDDDLLYNHFASYSTGYLSYYQPELYSKLRCS
jgi:hypothetical protein